MWTIHLIKKINKIMLRHVSCSICMFVQSVIPKKNPSCPFQTDMVLTACTQPNTPAILCSRLWLQCDRVSAGVYANTKRGKNMTFYPPSFSFRLMADSCLFAVCWTDKSHSRMLKDNKTVNTLVHPLTCTLTNPVQLFSS